MQSKADIELKWDLQAGTGKSLLFGLFALALALASQEAIMLGSGLGPFEIGGELSFGIPAWVMLVVLLVAAFLVSGACLPLFDRLMKRFGLLGFVEISGERLRVHTGKDYVFDLSKPLAILASWDVKVYKDEANRVDPLSTMVHVRFNQGSVNLAIVALAEFQEFRGFHLERITEKEGLADGDEDTIVTMDFNSLRHLLHEVQGRMW
jgi:hypothetical protein